MLFIDQPYIEKNQNKSRLVCNINIDQTEKQTIWFEVDEKYEKYLCTERSDAYIIGLLNWAMRTHHDITCKTPVSEDLLFNLNEYLIPSLIKYAPDFHDVKIHAPITNETLPNEGGVGTGLSCGIDSLHAIYKHFNCSYPSHKLTHLCINNVGAFNNCYQKYGIDHIRKERYEIAQKAAAEIGLPIITTDSNFQTTFKQNHLLTHTYSSMFAVFCMQKLWQTYFYGSSGYDFNSFTLTNHAQKDCSLYELLSLNCFSTRCLKIYSEGGAESRLEKTVMIADYNIAHQYLHVCTQQNNNCGICSKCRRTILCLDALGKLDKFSKVFDLQYYKKHKKEYLLWLYASHKNHDVMNNPTYNLLKKEITIKIKLYYYFQKLYKYMPIMITKQHIKLNLGFIKISFKHKKKK